MIPNELKQFTAGMALTGYAFILTIINIYLIDIGMFLIGSSTTAFSIGFVLILINYNTIFNLAFEKKQV